MSWLRVEGGSLVNLQYIGSVEMLYTTPIKNNDCENYHVSLYPANADAEPFTACEGSRSKCEDYMRALLEYVAGKEICAVGVHKCLCACGCQNEIREDFVFCEECDFEFEKDYRDHILSKKDAVRIAGNDPDGFTR